MRCRAWFLVLSVFLMSGCGASLRAAGYFEGEREEALVPAELVEESPALGVGRRLLGRVTSACTHRASYDVLEDDRLSDVDCHAARLTWVLRETAAEVGGTALVGTKCASRIISQGKAGAKLFVYCSAGVSRPLVAEASSNAKSTLNRPPGATASQAARFDEPDASSAFRIRLSLTRAPDAPERQPRSSELVREVAYQSLSQRPIGDLLARCDSKCSRGSVRHAIRLAAARLGADEVSEVFCAQVGGGWTCAGTASVSEVEEEVFWLNPDSD